MTTSVLLVRHGAHDRLGRVLCGRMPGVTLNATGQAQARQLGAAYGAMPFAAIYTSPQERARQTALPLAVACSLSVETDPDLDELDFGEWTGRSFNDLHPDPAWGRWNDHRQQARPPAGESALEAQLRIIRFLECAAERHPDASVAAFSHADVIKAAVCWVLGTSVNSHFRFDISPASASWLVLGNWGAKLSNLNHKLDSTSM